MARRETVGTAYILMRADGRLLEADIRRATQGGMKEGIEAWDEFDDRISATEKGSLRRFRNSMADAIGTGDFSRFRKEFGTVDNTINGVTEALRRMEKQNTISTEQMEKGVSSVKAWAVEERRRMQVEARNSERDFNEVSLRNTARYLRRMQTLYAEARRTGDWSPLSISKNEEASAVVRRVTADLEQYRIGMKMTRTQMEELSRSVSTWGETMQKAHEDSADSFVKMRQKVSEAELNKMGRDIATALAHDDWSKFKTNMETSREAAERFSRKVREDLGPALRMTDDDVRDIEASMRRWSGTVDRSSTDIDRSMGRIRFSIANASRRLRDFSSDRDSWVRIQRDADATSRRLNVFNLAFGRAFGKGSRNNFLNFTGSVLKGLLDIGRLPIMATAAIAGLGKSFAENLGKQQEAGVTGVRAAIGALRSTLGGGAGLAGAFVAVIAAMGVFGKLLPAIVSAASMLGSVLTNVVGSALIGIAGWLLAIGPLLVAGGAAIGVFIGAIMNMPEGTLERLQLQIQGVKDTLAEIGEQVAPQLERALSLVIGKVNGLVRNLGTSITTVLEDLNRRLASPEMDRFTAAWGESIPKMATNLGIAFNALGQGLTAFFVPILPYAERLAEHIRDAFEAFSAWSMAAENQNSIRNFMQDAWNTGKTLWNIIIEIGKALGKIFYQGAVAEGTDGKTFLEKIEDKLREFNTWLSSDEGKAAVKQWFEDGIEFAKTLYGVLEEVVAIFDRLDSEEGRESLGQILTGLETLLGWGERIAAFADEVGRLWDILFLDPNTDDTFSGIGEWLEGLLSGLWDSFVTWMNETNAEFDAWLDGLAADFVDAGIQAFIGFVEGLADGARAVGERVQEWIDSARETLGIASPSTVFLQMGLDVVAGFIQGLIELPGKALEVFNQMVTQVTATIAGWIGQTVEQIAGWIGQTVGQFSGWVGQVAGLISGWVGQVVGTISGWVGSTVGIFSGWVGSVRGLIAGWVGSVVGTIQGWAGSVRGIISGWAGAVSGIISGWVSGVLGTIRGWASSLSAIFTGAWNTVTGIVRSAAGALQGAAAGVVSAIGRGLSGLVSAVSAPFRSAVSAALGFVRQIQSAASSAISAAGRIIGNLTPWNAAGNIYYGPTIVGVGEAGPEAIVPLNRPLSQVDPSVRALSAIAQGLAVPGGGNTYDNGRSVSIAQGAITVMAPNANPYRVAESVLDHLAQELTG